MGHGFHIYLKLQEGVFPIQRIITKIPWTPMKRPKKIPNELPNDDYPFKIPTSLAPKSPPVGPLFLGPGSPAFRNVPGVPDLEASTMC